MGEDNKIESKERARPTPELQVFQPYFGLSKLRPLQKRRKYADLFHMGEIKVQEEEKGLVATLEVPGINEEDINIDISKDYLSITVEKTTREGTLKEGRFYQKVRQSTQKSRRFPYEVDLNQVSHSYKDGVLEVKLTRK